VHKKNSETRRRLGVGGGILTCLLTVITMSNIISPAGAEERVASISPRLHSLRVEVKDQGGSVLLSEITLFLPRGKEEPIQIEGCHTALLVSVNGKRHTLQNNFCHGNRGENQFVVVSHDKAPYAAYEDLI
jgi:hypothetical protein